MTLVEMRQKIDAIDQELMKWLELRFEVVQAIGHYKKINHLPVLDEAREKEVLETKKRLLKDQVHWPHYERIFKQIMAVSKDLEV